MLHILPLLVIGGGTAMGVKLNKKFGLKQKLLKQLQQSEDNYQKFFQQKIDPLFASKAAESRQTQTSAIQYNEQEAAINRRLGLSIANTKLALLGATLYHPLSWVSAAGLVYIMWPQRNYKIQLGGKRIDPRLYTALPVYGGLAAGYYVGSSLLAVGVLSAFKVVARSGAGSQAALPGNTLALQPPDSVWVQANGVETEIDFTELQAGDILVMTAGQLIPVNGEVVEGMAFISQPGLEDTSSQREVSVADHVAANTLVLSGKLYVRVGQIKLKVS